MHLIFCLDPKNGMLFHNRRQSRDCRVIEDIFHHLPSSKKLCIQPFSIKFMAAWEDQICVTNTFTTGETYFLETPPSEALLNSAQRITIYRWDKVYPADEYFTASLSDWMLKKTENIVGKSHDIIIKEVYSK